MLGLYTNVPGPVRFGGELYVYWSDDWIGGVLTAFSFCWQFIDGTVVVGTSF